MTDRVTILMRPGVVDRFEAHAFARGMTLDELVDRALEYIPQSASVALPKLLCDCCRPGYCAQAFRWRGSLRCGCPSKR